VRRIVHALVRALAPRLRALDVRRVSLLLERLLLVLRQHIRCYRMLLCRHDLSSSSSSSAAAGSQFTCVTSTKVQTLTQTRQQLVLVLVVLALLLLALLLLQLPALLLLQLPALLLLQLLRRRTQVSACFVSICTDVLVKQVN
jgi:hypothetical protein